MIISIILLVLSLFITITANSNNNIVKNIINNNDNTTTHDMSSSKLSLLAASIIPYTIVQAAPTWGSPYVFTNIANKDNSCWLGPDRLNGDQYQYQNDPTFYFILNLQNEYYVESLLIAQCNQWKGNYASATMKVSMSSDGVTYGSTVTVTATMSIADTQTLSCWSDWKVH